MNKLKLTLKCIVLLTSTFAFGDVFTFSLEGFPKQERDCFLQTQAISSMFEIETKTKVLHVECAKETETGYDFTIEYEAPSKLNFTTTDYVVSGVYPRGRYKEYKQCEENLNQQIELFQNATGLKPMFSYCKKEDNLMSKPWEIIIIAKGNSAIQPKLDGFLLFTSPQKITLEEIFNSLKTALAQKGAVLADLIFHARFPMAEASVHYFSEKRIQFSIEEVTKVPKLEICLTQVEEVSHWFDNQTSKPFTIYCGGPNFGEYELNIGSIDTPAFSLKSSVEKFGTFDECESNKTEVLKHYSGSTQKIILGGLCSRDVDTHKYNVIILRQHTN